MKYVLKLWFVIILSSCFCTTPDEDIDSLVSPSDQSSSTGSKNISINVKWENGDSDFSYKKEKINNEDTHVFEPKGSNKITSIYKDNSLIWQSTESMYCKLVHVLKPRTSSYSVTATIVINGQDVKKTFVSEGGFFYESGTICLNINKEENGADHKIDNQVRDKNGDFHWTANEGKKITLVIKKPTVGNTVLFWKSTDNWYCTKVTSTKVSGNVVKMTLELTNDSTKTKLVLVKQGDIWVPENTVYLNTEKKSDAPNCKYISQIQNKNGTYSYEPNEGYKIMRVCHGSLTDEKKLVWHSPGNLYCTKVTGTVASDKTTKLLLDLKGDKNVILKKNFELKSDGWVETNVEDPKETPKSGK